MKNTLLIILVLAITTSCTNNKGDRPVSSKLDKNIDSVLLHLAKKYELTYKLNYLDSVGTKICDSTHLQKSFPLVKKVYYKDLDLTFEFRQSSDCHELLEIIICYNDSIIYGIPFRDNYYFFRYKSDTSKYYSKLSFEKELNNAINTFVKYDTNLINRQIPLSLYTRLFVCALMDNLTKFNCRKIIPQLGDMEAIKKRTQERINDRLTSDDDCKKNALSNINKLENELKDSSKSILLYYFMMNDCIYCFTFEDFAKTSKYVSVKVINKECYFDIIY